MQTSKRLPGIACTLMCLTGMSLLVSGPVIGQEAQKKNAAANERKMSASDQEKQKFFEAKIRPVLVEHCYACHSAEAKELAGGLQVDGRDGLLKGGDSGPAIVPGKPDKSLLLVAMRHTNRDLIMPPKDSGPKLSDAILADFDRWIRTGAFDPRTETPQAKKKKLDPEAAKKWWSWQARKPVQVPAVQNTAWVHNDIDRFVLARLESEGLQPNPDCDRVTLVRRLAFDLTGLPPTVPEIYDFALAPEPKPIEQLVDRYLESTAYGERMARRWLDVARYAESAGKDLNGMFPHAWRYRDYVIDAFNSDMSFRTFIAEQIAGDLLSSRNKEEQARRTIATGFLAIGPKGLNDMSARQFAADVADEQIDTLSQAFLGITIACARCHDHKFDPISQRDYTAMAGIFLSTETHYGTQGGVGGRNRSSLVELPDSMLDPKAYTRRPASELKQMKERLETLREEQREMLAERLKERAASGGGAGNPGPEFLRVQTQIVSLETELSLYDEDGSMKALAMAVSDKPQTSEQAGFFAQRMRGQERGQERGQGPRGPGGAGPFGGPGAGPPGAGPLGAGPMGAGPLGRPGPLGMRPGMRLPQRPGALPPEMQIINDSPLFERGDVDKPGERVPRGLPVFFVRGSKADIPNNVSGRLELAKWIANENNPLTVRVIANRIWGWTIGRGIVASVDNFGSTGDLPSHPELLDYLGAEFVKHNWSVKQLTRQIVLSHTYALSSETNESNFEKDPDNNLLWRANPRTLEAEAVRDAMLSAAGLLEQNRPHGSLISQAGDGVIGGRANGRGGGGITEDSIAKAGGTFRSIYLPIPRNLLPDSMELFDFPDNSMVHGTRETTLVPSQALYWMNSQAVDRSAAQIAARVFPGMDIIPSSRPTPRGNGQASSSSTSRGSSNAGNDSYGPRRSEIDIASAFNDICLLTLSRQPLPKEQAAVESFVTEQRAQGVTEASIWTSICRSVLSSADFRRVR